MEELGYWKLLVGKPPEKGMVIDATSSIAAFKAPRSREDELPDEMAQELSRVPTGAKLSAEYDPGSPLLEKSRLLLVNPVNSVRVYGVPTERGWLCWVNSRFGAQCIASFAHGIALRIDQESAEEPLTVHGIFEDVVKEVAIIGRGQIVQGLQHGNAFVVEINSTWHGDEIEAVRVTRVDGSVETVPLKA